MKITVRKSGGILPGIMSQSGFSLDTGELHPDLQKRIRQGLNKEKIAELNCNEEPPGSADATTYIINILDDENENIEFECTDTSASPELLSLIDDLEFETSKE